MKPDAPVTLAGARRALRAHADPAKAAFLRRFFHAFEGGYGEGDRFLGVTVPRIRGLVRTLRTLLGQDVEALVRSPFHEERLLGLLLWVDRNRRASERERFGYARRYVALRRHVDNWDLVDASAPFLLGPHLHRFGDESLLRLAASRRVWDRRIAVLATFHEIKQGRFERFFRVAERVRDDDHELIRKALGWMLREVGRRDPSRLEAYLGRHQLRLPRTTLRYAIERLPPARRAAYLAGRG